MNETWNAQGRGSGGRNCWGKSQGGCGRGVVGADIDQTRHQSWCGCGWGRYHKG